jgi:hypothetical protein
MYILTIGCLYALFIYLFRAAQTIFRYLAAVTITGDRAPNLVLCLALICVTPTATRDLLFKVIISYPKDP